MIKIAMFFDRCVHTWIAHMCAHQSINRAVEELIHVKFVIMNNRSQTVRDSSPTISNGLLGKIEHPKGTASPFTSQKQFPLLLSFLTALLIADRSKDTERSKRSIKPCLVSKVQRVKLSLWNFQ